MMFGLCSIPILIAIGVYVDYARATDIRSKLDGAADAATLQAVSKNANPFVVTPTATQVQQNFVALASNVKGVTLSNVQATIAPAVTNLAVTLNYTGQVNTLFGGIIGTNMVTITGTSTAQVNAPPYVNFYLLLDNSPSMGLGATPTDITNLINYTANQKATTTPNVKTGSIARASCAFACHQHTFNSKGQITGDDLTDNYHVAKANGVTTRIDVLRTATQQLTQTAADVGDKAQSVQHGHLHLQRHLPDRRSVVFHHDDRGQPGQRHRPCLRILGSTRCPNFLRHGVAVHEQHHSEFGKWLEPDGCREFPVPGDGWGRGCARPRLFGLGRSRRFAV